MADSRTPKDAEDHIPFCKDQGLHNLCGAGTRGVSIQVIPGHVTASDPETLTFADLGLMDMADADYAVFGQNQTDVADQPYFDAKAAGSFQMNGPDAADVVDIVVVGRLKGQLAE